MSTGDDRKEFVSLALARLFRQVDGKCAPWCVHGDPDNLETLRNKRWL